MRLRPLRRLSRSGDDGSTLIWVLVFMALAAVLITPMLRYTSVVLSSGGVQRDRTIRGEATRGALRVALADPVKLYAACSDSGLRVPVTLASPPDLGVSMRTQCTTMSQATEQDPGDLRTAVATVAAGSTTPVGAVGSIYEDSGDPDVDGWWDDTTSVSEGNKIFLPLLPTHGLNHPATVGYMMPTWAGSCRVFFPGTYDTPVSITDSVPTFFTSGVYYFESTITIGASANVVIGEGAVEGCTTNAEAAFYAVNAPNQIAISGIGATFIFGGEGRMLITDGGAATGPSVSFNARLVDPTDVGNAVTQGVSIMSVNGLRLGNTTSTNLSVENYLAVPRSLTESNPSDEVAPVDAASTGYKASTLVPAPAPAAPATPVVQISLTGAGAASIYVPGYVALPQGRIDVTVATGVGANKSVQILGGVLAALVTQSTEQPADMQIGVVNRVVQKTFKIVAESTSGAPRVVSTAIVQVNEYGEFAINSWITSS